jgi:hypothetical protein
LSAKTVKRILKLAEEVLPYNLKTYAGSGRNNCMYCTLKSIRKLQKSGQQKNLG